MFSGWQGAKPIFLLRDNLPGATQMLKGLGRGLIVLLLLVIVKKLAFELEIIKTIENECSFVM